jgi:hypothetical protein
MALLWLIYKASSKDEGIMLNLFFYKIAIIRNRYINEPESAATELANKDVKKEQNIT